MPIGRLAFPGEELHASGAIPVRTVITALAAVPALPVIPVRTVITALSTVPALAVIPVRTVITALSTVPALPVIPAPPPPSFLRRQES
ncbi:MAG TPA: hypothetical protein PK480_12555 [Candidatus Hydrogenedentes bacterium]|nr:hypothetical protein [Candidatus Hydrogenedentota bacterium]